MKLFEGKSLRQRRAIGGSIAAATAGAVILTSALVPMAASALDGADPTNQSAAQGQIIQLPAALLGGIDVAAVGHTLTSNPAAPGFELGGLDADVLQALNLNLGTLNIPLLTDGTTPGLLNLGDLGATQSYSNSPSLTESIASSGTITSGGAIDTGAIDGSSSPAQLELTDLFDQLGVAGLTDQILDEASIGIGALASRATENAGTVDSEYRIADLKIDLHSQLLDTLADTVDTTVQGAVTPVSNLVGTGGALDSLLGSISSTLNGLNLIVARAESTGASATINGLDTVGQTVSDELLNQPIANETGSVLIDLESGTISVDLAKILVETGAGADLNSLPANTAVLSAATISAIQQGITSALTGTGPESLNGKLTTILTNTLNNLQVSLKVNLALKVGIPPVETTAATGDITIAGTLAQFAGIGAQPTVTPNITLLGLDLSLLTTPVVNLLTSTLASVTGPLVNTALTSTLPLLQTALSNLTTPLLGSLDPVLQGVLSNVATITINRQPASGDLPGDSFTVRALAINLLPAVGGGVELDLASSSVKAADEAAVAPTVDAQDPVQAGANLPVTGADWVPGSTVTLTLRDASNNTIGTPVPVTVAGDGTFPAGTVYGIPANTPEGTGYVLTAVDDQDPQNIATDTVSVTAGGGGDVNTNAAASASASADATANGDPAAQAAAVAAALADATSTASAAANANANQAAKAAATTDASTNASADSTSAANAQAAAAAQAAAQADNSSTATANSTASTAANANSSVASQAAATSNASTQASSEASTNANAAASASASANANASTSAVAQAAAQAAAYSDATAQASAASDADATDAAQVAATAQASTTATANATSAANANAAAAAQAAALADASSNTKADDSAQANSNAGSASETAAIATSSADASVEAAASANASATTNTNASASTTATSEADTNASASAAASAQADNDNNAAAQAAAVAAALANADTQASAKATANANAAAVAAATAQAEAGASTNASTDATSETNARAAAAAQSSAEADSSQAATAQANANASAAASAAANANASTEASAAAAADVEANATASTTATANTNASASANANPTGKLGITVKVPVLERGQQQTAVGTGFKPGEVVSGVMNSDPLALGTQVANAEGTVTFTWAIPAGTDLGTHSVTLTGAESGSVAGTFQVVAKGLATTGGTAPNGWIVLGALLLMFGLGTALVARSKRETVTAE